MAAKRNGGDLPPVKKWAGLAFLLIGVAFVLLFVYGPPSDGRGDILKIIGGSLIFVAVSLFAGINLPSFDWSNILVTVLSKLLEGQQRKEGN